jgi:predicted transcriptional regulator
LLCHVKKAARQNRQKELLCALVDEEPTETVLKLRLRAGKKGIELRLHDLEAAIMDIVWSKQLSAFAVSEVLAVLEKRRDIAYTTVMTTVARLHQKGVLERKRDGRRYLYSPRLTREQFLESTAREVLNGAVGGHQAMAMLAEQVSEASAGELDELEALIQRRREELGA